MYLLIGFGADSTCKIFKMVENLSMGGLNYRYGYGVYSLNQSGKKGIV